MTALIVLWWSAYVVGATNIVICRLAPPMVVGQWFPPPLTPTSAFFFKLAEVQVPPSLACAQTLKFHLVFLSVASSFIGVPECPLQEAALPGTVCSRWALSLCLACFMQPVGSVHPFALLDLQQGTASLSAPPSGPDQEGLPLDSAMVGPNKEAGVR